MSDFRSIVLGMRTNTGGLSKGLASAKSQIGGFKSSISQIGGTDVFGGITGGFAKIGLAIQGVTSIAKGVGSAIIGPLKAAADAEKTATSFRVLTGSAENAEAVLADLRKFGQETPFEFPEIADSAKKLIAFGIDAKVVTGQLRRLGDISAGLDIPLNELADLYGKARVQGRLFGEDINQLAGRGIPIQAELAKQFGVTEESVKGLVESGKVNFGNLQKAVESLTSEGGKFGGLMAAQSETLGGLWSNFSDLMGTKLTALGEWMVKAFNIKGLLSSAIGSLDSFQSQFDGVLSGLEMGLSFVQPIFEQFGNVVIARFWSIVETGSWMWNQLAGFWTGLGLPSMTQMRDFILDALIIAEFGFTNFWKILELGGKTGLLGIVQFAAGAQYQFTTVIPKWLEWFGENWQEIIGHIVNESIKRFDNMATNLISLFQNLPGLIAGTTDWGEVWNPFEATALKAVVDLPEIPERVKGQFEQELARDVAGLANGLTDKLGDLRNKRWAELMPAQPGQLQNVSPAEPPKPAGTASGPAKASESEAPKLLSASAWGSQQARESILRHEQRGVSSSKDPISIAKEQRELAKQQLEEQRQMNRLLRKSYAGGSETVTVNVMA